MAIIETSKVHADTSKRRALSPDFNDTLLAIEEWLIKARYTDIDVLAFGTDGMVFYSKSNPDIVIRVGTRRERDRLVLPQAIQPIFSARIKRDFLLEILPKLDTKSISLIKHYDAFSKEMETAYADDGKMLRGYVIREGHLTNNLGIFHYRDTQGRKKSVSMAYDPATIEETMRCRIEEEDGSVYQTDERPKCTKHYPTLQDQRHRQLEIIRDDERLQNLVGKEGELLPPYPETIVVSSPTQSPPRASL